MKAGSVKTIFLATSFIDLDTKTEWISVAPALPSSKPPAQSAADRSIFRGASGVFLPSETESLRLEDEEATSDSAVEDQLRIFPGASDIRMWLVQQSNKSMPTQELNPNQISIEAMR